MNYTANIARENELNKIKKVDQANCAELNKIIENIIYPIKGKNDRWVSLHILRRHS